MRAIRSFCMAVVMAGTLGISSAQAQELIGASEPAQEVTGGRMELAEWSDSSLFPSDPQQPSATTDGQSSPPDAPSPQASPADPNHPNSSSNSNPNNQFGKQPKRILWVIPNYRAVSANTQLPPLSFKEELWLATQDTFDYSDFIFVGGLAGIEMASKSQPSFGQGAEGYGKYYWHLFVDGSIENYMTEAIVPGVTREDPRYYTLGKGGFIKRTGYAVSRLFITKTNSGKSTFNLSEIVGAGAAAGIGNAYYPAESNPWVKTYQRWGTQVGLDGVFNVLKEFWPDINQAVFRGKY
ncbi:MAG TPA: hypothetical protein VN946_14275 [Terriglobales bacterium]|nr:hypothetical protein [Terriglobales bacterium]